VLSRVLSGLTISALLLAAAPSVGVGQDRDAESAAVLRAVMDMLYRSGDASPKQVIVRDSLYLRSGGVSYNGRILLPYQSSIDSGAIVDFEKVTSRSVAFPKNFRYVIPLHRISPEEHESITARGEALAKKIPPRELREMPYWLGFIEKYPRVWGATVLSRVGFNGTFTQALTYFRHQCGGGCQSAEVVFLRKEARGWKVTERISDGSSESLGSGAMRYLGRGAHFLADIRRVKDSTRRAVADSIRRDRAPRRVRGTVINRQTGRAIRGAQIFVRSHLDPVKPWGRVVTDSRGRYEVRNPPIGATMFELQCPGPVHKHGATLDAPGFYVFPEVDTIIDMAAPNIMPCWLPRRVHRIVSGRLESAAHNGYLYPAPAEQGVYDAVLKELYPNTGGALPILNASTHERCRKREECERLEVSHLIRAGIIDSATFVDFQLKSQEMVPLDRAFAARRGLSLLVSEERAYLSEEGGWKEYMDTAAASKPSGFWRALQEAYPETSAIVSMSRPGFDPRGLQAMVQVGYETDRSGVSTETLLVRNDGGQWKVDRRHLEKEIVSGEIVAGKCLPAFPGAVPAYGSLGAIRGDYSFTLVSNVGDGKVIDWQARFIPDTIVRKAGNIKGLSPAQQAEYLLRIKSPLPVFEVIDPRTGVRDLGAEPGTYFESADRYFMNASRTGQFDGFGYTFDIRRVEGDALFGQWTHYSFGIAIDVKGQAIPEPAGHFCAVRRPAP